jgi:hypothetical protein
MQEKVVVVSLCEPRFNHCVNGTALRSMYGTSLDPNQHSAGAIGAMPPTRVAVVTSWRRQ